MESDERVGRQFLIDPSGNRWEVTGYSAMTCYIKNDYGTEIAVGRSILRIGLGRGTWKEEFVPND